MNHREKMLKWIDDLGLIVIHTEIKPYGKGTRRYLIGRHIEEPKEFRSGSGKIHKTPGEQEWLTPLPLTGVQLEEWLKEWQKNQ